MLEETLALAAKWVESARAALARDDDLRRAALDVNFAWARVPPPAAPMMLAFVADHFASIASVMTDATIFRSGGPHAHPAYTFEGHVWLNEGFATFGPKCRAAMIIHECVHVFDARSGEPAIHVSEWDEPRFSAIPPELQVHNPSAYASFAAQVHHGALAWPRDARFGAGRPKE